MRIIGTRKKILTALFAICGCFFADAQNREFNIPEIFSYALDGNISSVLSAVQGPYSDLSPRDSIIKQKFEERFRYAEDRSGYMKEKDPVSGLIVLFRDYWRKSFLNNGRETKYEGQLQRKITSFLRKNYAPASKLKAGDTQGLNTQLVAYIKSLGLHSTGYNNTGKYKDLYIWTVEKDSLYHLDINGRATQVRVVFMEDFVTLGWMEYATLGKMYSGGWATKDALYCVKKAYDLESEQFKISYLAHEGKHFTDYIDFPQLSGPDLEYRAKLTELSLLQDTLYTVIEFFLSNADYDSDNAHQIANFCVIRDLSRVLFHTDFENDSNKWKALTKEQIHKTALLLLEENTTNLDKVGPAVKNFIKQ